jgi:CRP-like cAMP-binding protein
MASEEVERKTGLRRNRLLNALSVQDYEAILPQLEVVELELKQILQEQNQPTAYVYFPLNSVASILNIMEDGSAVEVATVGNEGMVGLPVYLGSEQMPSQVFCQVVGQSARLEVAVFRQATRLPGSGSFRQIMDWYTQALFTQTAQNAACNRLHSIEERCARWLLMTHDRVASDQFPLTQEFLGQMLGVRRAGVNAAAGRLHKHGFIRYSQGVIFILDREGLLTASCSCYQIITGEYNRLLG